MPFTEQGVEKDLFVTTGVNNNKCLVAVCLLGKVLGQDLWGNLETSPPSKDYLVYLGKHQECHKGSLFHCQ